MVLDLSALLSWQGSGQDTAINLYSMFPFPARADRKLDAFQQDAWNFLSKNPQGYYSRSEVQDGRHVVRVAVADTMVGQSCVNCHNTTDASPKRDWKLGDVRGVLDVTSVIDQQLANGAVLSRSIIAGAILIGLALLAITLLVARSVTRPIERLIDAMQKVAAGNFQTTLPGLGRADEIGRLAGAFNHMVSDLAAARDREALDRTRTAAMQAELTRVARLNTMGRMAASIAHEVNQPLSAIVTNGHACLRWLARTPPELDETRDTLDQIVKEGHRAADIIGGIRAIFRKGDGARAPVDVNELISEVLTLTDAEIRNGQVAVRTKLVDDARVRETPGILGDRVQLQLVFRNLIMNAIEAMSSVTDRERTLSIESATEPSGVRITVTDTGEGIDTANMDRIFQTFFTTKSHGTGMGLPICRSIIESHGGKLSASRAHPHGSVFEIVLPVGRVAPAPGREA
jgi:signal transduction histidine kinase